MQSLDVLPLRRLLADPFHFQLPVYQRRYAWSKGVARQLIDDVLDSQALENSEGGPVPYSLGAVILDPVTPRKGSRKRFGRRRAVDIYDIVDGQQRLVSITLLLCVLRDLLNDPRDKSLPKAIESSSAAAFPFRLTMRDEDEVLFTRFAKEPGATLIDAPPDQPSDTAQHLFENRNHFLRTLRALSSHEEMWAFAGYLLDYCQIAVLACEKHDDPIQVYHSFNHKGMALNRSNQLKAYVLGDIADRGDPELQAYADDWKKWEDDLGIATLDLLIGIVRTIYGKGRKKVVELNLDIMEEAGGGAAYMKTVLGPAVVAYKKIVDTSNDHPEVHKYLTYLKWVDGKDNKDWYAPVFRWFEHNPSDEETAAFLKRLDRLAYGLVIKGTSINDRAARYRAVFNEINENGLPETGSAIDLTATEQKRILYRLGNDFQKHGARTCKLVLLRLCDEIDGTPTPKVPDRLSVEHVLPRNVKPDSPWVDAFESTDSRNLRFRRLANLVLLTEEMNRLVSSVGFAEKKAIIFAPENAHLREKPDTLTNFLAACDVWNEEVLDTREDELVAILKNMWKLEGPAGRETDRIAKNHRAR
ncbi:MAG: DUF262 domain-containing protein [Hyphomicrobiaceae bacterium]